VKPQSSAKIEIGQLIDERKLSSLQILVMVMSALVVWLDGYHIQSMALVVPMIAKEWSLKPSDFQWVLDSALIGIALGSAFIANMGDRFGRRKVLIISMAVIGISSIATGYANGRTGLILWRFLTGLGLGASIPNAIALTTDYVPSKRKAALVTLMFTGMSIGALTAGLAGPDMVKHFLWRGMFTLAGVLPLVMSLLLITTIPESLRLLLARNPDDRRIPKILAKLAPDVDAREVYARKQEVQRQSVIELLNPTYRKGTLLLWFVFFFNMFILYLLVTWLPTLLTAQGWSSRMAMYGTGIIQAGGVAGGLVLSRYVDKGKTVVATVTAYLITAVAFGLFAQLPSHGPSWWILLVVVGSGISGGQFVLNALGATYYPPVIRSTGVGWVFSIGRIGAIISPFAGAWIQSLVAPSAVLTLLIIPVALCVVGVLMFRDVFQPAPAVMAAAAKSVSSKQSS
jgi:AAHS family 4-hydroxybenzoate transporter-like MFS transporter